MWRGLVTEACLWVRQLRTRMINVRFEQPSDASCVREVNELAFDSQIEARIVESLREAPDSISLVAIKNDLVIGHILPVRKMCCEQRLQQRLLHVGSVFGAGQPEQAVRIARGLVPKASALTQGSCKRR